MLLDILNALLNKAENTTDATLGVLENFGGGLMEGLSFANVWNAITTFFIKFILDGIFGIAYQFLNWIRNLFYGYSGPVGPFAVINAILATVSTIILIIIIMKKNAQNNLNIAGGGEGVPATQLIIDAIKASGLCVILPWFVSFATAVLPAFAEMIFTQTLIFSDSTAWGALISIDERAYVDGGWEHWLVNQLNPGWWVLSFFLALMVTIGAICFLVSQCKWHVEIMIMDACSILAALDSITDKKEFYETWLSSFKALCIVQVTNIALFGLMVNRFINLCNSSSNFFSMDAIFAIGASCCLIKGTIFTNKFKNGGMLGGGVSAVTNAARTGVFMLPR